MLVRVIYALAQAGSGQAVKPRMLTLFSILFNPQQNQL